MLNNHQKAFLRGLANRLKVTVMVGKDGVSDNLIESLEHSLTAHELVKIAVLKSAPESVDELRAELAAASGSEAVCSIGRNIVLFRANADSRINLPK